MNSVTIWKYSSSMHPGSCVLWRTVPQKFTFLGFFENWFLDRASQWEICKKLKGKKESQRISSHCRLSLHNSNSLQVIPVVGYDSHCFPPTSRKDTGLLPVLIPAFGFQFFQYLCKQNPFIKSSLLFCLSCMAPLSS